MLQLPQGCSCSEPSVFPRDWKRSSASVKLKWRIQFYFYDADKKRTLHVVKGMNAIKNYTERKSAVISLIAELKTSLKEGYNPSTNAFDNESFTFEITRLSTMHDALSFAYKELHVGELSLSPIKSFYERMQKAIADLGIKNIMLKEVRTRHIRMILKKCTAKYNLSAHSFNHYRAYMMMLFKILLENDAVEYNPVINISKQQIIKKLKRLLTQPERALISDYFKNTDIYFFRFIQIFFHSGARPIELLQMKKNDIDLLNGTYKIIIKKGKLFEEQLRPIKNIAMGFWQEQFDACTNETDYFFGSKLRPSSKKATRDYITKKWHREVKIKLGINKDLYSLKHLNLDQTAGILNINDASKMAGHTSTIITLNHYLINEKERQMQRLKHVDNPFS